MQLIRIAAVALNQTPLDWDGNRDRMVAAIEEARGKGADLICLPEMCICGYGCEDMFLSPGVRRMSRQVLAEILPATKGLAVTVGLPVMHEGGLYNCCAVIVDGAVAGFVAKQALCREGLHYEPRWFNPWKAGQRGEVTLDGETYPIGDLFFDLAGVRIAVEICEDAWIVARPGATHARRGVDIILNPSASHFAFGKVEIRRRIVLESSRSMAVTYVYSNLVGNEAGRAIYDGHMLIGSRGRTVAEGPRFLFHDHAVTVATIDIDATRMARAQASGVQEAPAEKAEAIRAPFEWRKAKPDGDPIAAPPWEKADPIEREEFTRAVSLALFDYMRKSRSRGYIVSLSGGADSTAVAVLVYLMAKLGCAHLGIEGFKKKLGHIDFDKAANGRRPSDPPPLREGLGEGDAAHDNTLNEQTSKKSVRQSHAESPPPNLPLEGEGPEQITALMPALLTTVYQSTKNSSQTTRSAARAVADAVGARHFEFDVDDLVRDYTAIIEQAIGRKLTWENDDIALQNIQARVRAPGVWMLANLTGALLAATSNRSEAAVGYATMDGDTSGGISPIAGIDKAFLRNWLTWMQSAGPVGVGPLPALRAVTELEPTAELRPLEHTQTDEKDLMPYDLLDAVEEAAIGEKKTPIEVYDTVQPRFDRYEPQQLVAWIERFFRLWSRNQWKRERYAPSFHVDDRNLDPKTWCRFPILSGGYERELRALRAYVGV